MRLKNRVLKQGKVPAEMGTDPESGCICWIRSGFGVKVFGANAKSVFCDSAHL